VISFIEMVICISSQLARFQTFPVDDEANKITKEYSEPVIWCLLLFS